jgi:hypothetical protein
MMAIRTRKDMSRSFQRPWGNWLPAAADPQCLLSTYFGTKKLAIYFYKLRCPSGAELVMPPSGKASVSP